MCSRARCGSSGPMENKPANLLLDTAGHWPTNTRPGGLTATYLLPMATCLLVQQRDGVRVMGVPGRRRNATSGDRRCGVSPDGATVACSNHAAVELVDSRTWRVQPDPSPLDRPHFAILRGGKQIATICGQEDGVALGSGDRPAAGAISFPRRIGVRSGRRNAALHRRNQRNCRVGRCEPRRCTPWRLATLQPALDGDFGRRNDGSSARDRETVVFSR